MKTWERHITKTWRVRGSSMEEVKFTQTRGEDKDKKHCFIEREHVV